jgi:hypothetical protein
MLTIKELTNKLREFIVLFVNDKELSEFNLAFNRESKFTSLEDFTYPNRVYGYVNFYGDVIVNSLGVPTNRTPLTFEIFKTRYMKPTENETSITITRERILEAAAKCTDAKATLKILFPEVFVVEDKSINTAVLMPNACMVNNAYMGPGYNKSFILNRDWNWEIKYIPTQGFHILIPTKK